VKAVDAVIGLIDGEAGFTHTVADEVGDLAIVLNQQKTHGSLPQQAPGFGADAFYRMYNVYRSRIKHIMHAHAHGSVPSAWHVRWDAA